MRGIIYLRGMMIPVVELRRKPGLKEGNSGYRECAIVIDLATDDDMVVVGVDTDAVHDVFELRTNDIETAEQDSFKESFTQGLPDM